MRYRLIAADSIAELEELVNGAIETEWTLQGGVSVTQDTRVSKERGYGFHYAQAMVKGEE